ncbi:MAG: hypothetical protein K6F50_05650 [Kiritimatiellae bacterium]|nr:hypothetical protein [Kiritimatiellia bacterium]
MSIAAGLVLAATFTRAMERVGTLDPIKAQSAYDARAVMLVYETPLSIDYAARPYRLSPGVCELPEVTPDGLVYSFRMTQDARVGAADVVRSLERLRDEDGSAGSIGKWTMKAVKAIRATGERTFEIELKERQHVFPWFLAMDYAAVSAPDGGGTGPYRLASWWRNHEMVFERNPEWPGWKGNPSGFDRIRYLVVSDASTQWLMFLRGELDCLGEIARDNWSAVMDGEGRLDPFLASRGVRLCGGEPALEIRYIGMNMRDPVLGANRKLRQAISCAFDFPTWRKFYNNSIDRADGPVPPGVAGRLETPSPYGYDLEKAKRLLAEAGYPGGKDPATGRRLVLTLSIGRPTQDSREAGELLASFYERIGVKLELRFETWPAFLAAVNRGDVQLYQMAWVGDYPDAENFLQLFHSANKSPGPNHSDYENPEYDAEYDAAMASATEEERNRHWIRCQEILREDCPWIFTHVTKNYSLVNSRVGNFISSDFPYGQERHLRVEK